MSLIFFVFAPVKINLDVEATFLAKPGSCLATLPIAIISFKFTKAANNFASPLSAFKICLTVFAATLYRRIEDAAAVTA